MAFVAETVGAQPIDFKSATGEVIKGATEAAGLYAAQQKAEATKIELENMKVKQDSMKAGIFLDYMDKIKNSPNPAVKKVLMKQYGAQHQKMYGGPMDENTLKAISDSPDFGQTLDGLIQNMGIEGAGKEYANMINKLASSLGLPYVDAEKTMKQAFDYYIEEKKAKEAASLASSRLGLSGQRYELSEGKATLGALTQAEEDPQVREFELQMTGADKGLSLMQKGLKNHRDTGGVDTITWGQLSEAMTDLAALQAVKASAVVPIGREKNITVDLPEIQKFISEIKTNATSQPDKGVPLDVLKVFAEQFKSVKTLLTIAHDRELDKGYSRGVDAGLLNQEMVNKRKKTITTRLQSQLEQTKQQLGTGMKKSSVRDQILMGASYEDIKSKLPENMRSGFTMEMYNSVKNTQGAK
jgi:hypothetical protein